MANDMQAFTVRIFRLHVRYLFESNVSHEISLDQSSTNRPIIGGGSADRETVHHTLRFSRPFISCAPRTSPVPLPLVYFSLRIVNVVAVHDHVTLQEKVCAPCCSRSSLSLHDCLPASDIKGSSIRPLYPTIDLARY
jgi:hypothetical protein